MTRAVVWSDTVVVTVWQYRMAVSEGIDMADSGSKKEPTFEESLAELECIVTAIEEGKVGLQDAIAQYEKGTKLIQRCRSVLAEAEAKVQQLQVGQDGKLEIQKEK